MPAITNYLTIDVEDYFQVSAFEGVVRPEDWSGRESRVERNTGKILQLLAERGIKATFFIVGWIAERHPQLVRNIVAAGTSSATGAHLLDYEKIPLGTGYPSRVGFPL